MRRPSVLDLHSRTEEVSVCRGEAEGLAPGAEESMIYGSEGVGFQSRPISPLYYF